MFLNQNDKVQLYLDDICSQIRFSEAHQEIRLEIESHIQIKIQELLDKGLTKDEAVDQAISQMGGATLVGKQLDIVHQSRPEWSIIILSLFFISLGLLSMLLIGKQGLSMGVPIFEKSIIFTIIGTTIVASLYLFDYRRLEIYSLHIYFGTILILAIAILINQVPIGVKSWFSLGFVHFDLVAVSPLLFSIALAGILNKWNWNDSARLFQGLLLLTGPLVFILAGNNSLDSGITYSAICIMLMIASGAKSRGVYLLFFILATINLLSIKVSQVKYEQLTTFINPQQDPLGSGWVYLQVNELITSAGLFGHGLTLESSTLYGLHANYVFTYIIFAFGWISGLFLVALFAIFISRLVSIANIVKINYAKLLISALTTIFIIQILGNILMNLGLGPIVMNGLPFVSYGGSQLIINAIAIGLILSVYRRRYFTMSNIVN